MQDPRPLPQPSGTVERTTKLRVVGSDERALVDVRAQRQVVEPPKEHLVVEPRDAATEVVARPADEVGAPVPSRAPISYRVMRTAVKVASHQPSSLLERFEYSMAGDWTAAGSSDPRRHLHLTLMAVGLIVFSAPGFFLIWVGALPQRWGIFLVMLVLAFLIFVL